MWSKEAQRYAREFRPNNVDLDLGPFLDAVTALTFPGDAKNQDDWLDFCRRWQNALGALSSDAYLALLLAYLPSLRTLEIDVMEDSFNGIIFEMLHRYSGRKDACGTTPILGLLTHLYVYGVEQDSASTARLPIEQPRIPSLSHFYGFKLGVIELDEEYRATDGSFPRWYISIWEFHRMDRMICNTF